MPRRARAGPIVVIGSINMDLVCRTRRLPRRGETVLGSEILTVPGGKGANQAVAAARIADGRVDVRMIGRVGDDQFGGELLAGLKANGVDTRRVRVTKRTASGVAMICVDAEGENSIVVTPMPMPEALRLANAAGALCCTRIGAQPALPTRRAVERLVSRSSRGDS